MDLLAALRRDEGLRLEAYSDSVGIKTIGYGHNLMAHGQEDIDSCTLEQAEAWLAEDAARASSQLASHLPWTDQLDDARRGVLQNMAFNIGIGKLVTFHQTLGFIQGGDYANASVAMAQSLWARQVGARAVRLCRQMTEGEWQ